MLSVIKKKFWSTVKGNHIEWPSKNETNKKVASIGKLLRGLT